MLNLQIQQTIAQTNEYIEELRRKSIYRKYPNLSNNWRRQLVENNKPYGPDVTTFIEYLDINGRLKDLDFSKSIPFRETFGRYFLCYDGTEGHESFYIKRMKTAEEYAREQHISVVEFLEKINEGRGQPPPLWFLTKQFYVKPVWRKKGFVEFIGRRNGRPTTIARLDYDQDFLNTKTNKIYVADLITRNQNYVMYRNQDVVQQLTNWKRQRENEDVEFQRNVRRRIGQ